MAKKIMVKKMDFDALSTYNKASVELVDLMEKKANELKPLREERKSIIAKRTEALAKEGAVLDDVLREFSVDKIDMAIDSVNEKYKKPLAECDKAMNSVLKRLNPNTFYAYAVAMDSKDTMYNVTGEFTYTKSNGEVESVVITAQHTFFKCIKAFYEDLGAFCTDDSKAMAKVVGYHAKRVGGLKFDRKTQDNVLKKKSEVCNSLVRDVINYLVYRGVVEESVDGTLTVVTKEEEQTA